MGSGRGRVRTVCRRSPPAVALRSRKSRDDPPAAAACVFALAAQAGVFLQNILDWFRRRFDLRSRFNWRRRGLYVRRSNVEIDSTKRLQAAHATAPTAAEDGTIS